MSKSGVVLVARVEKVETAETLDFARNAFRPQKISFRLVEVNSMNRNRCRVGGASESIHFGEVSLAGPRAACRSSLFCLLESFREALVARLVTREAIIELEFLTACCRAVGGS